MAMITKTFPNDQHNYWSTGISIPAGQYISSISIHCDYANNESSEYVALYIDGKQLATIAPNLYLGAVNGSASGNITGTTITASQNSFSFRSEVTITYTLASYAVARSISKTVSPSGAGSFTVKKNGSEVSSAYKNDSIAVAASANSGYVFKNWTTSPANLLGNAASASFTMPDQNVSITANYWKLSTGSLSKSSLEGGSSVTLTITMQSTALKHYYNLSFGSGMSTGDVLVNAGVSSVTFTVPLNWSAQIPNASSKGSGTLTLKTYNGNTYLGSTTVSSSLTYTVPASVKPSMGTIMTSVARTIDGVTYGNIGDVYAQNHCGVRVQASASGQQSATITSLTVKIGSYSGNKYNKTVSSGNIDFTSGLLWTNGTMTITVTATDSRGRTNSATKDITVSAYIKPRGNLQVWRVNSGGTTDDMGVYAKYQLTKQYSAIGNNSLSWSLEVSGQSKNSPEDTGNLLPDNRLEFSETQEYTVTLTLTDGLETTVIITKLPSARFVMAFDSTGNKIGIMKFPDKAIPAGKNRTFEISKDTQVYIGDDKLDDLFKEDSLTSGTVPVISSPIDFNTYINVGTWRFDLSSVVNQCSNRPSNSAGRLIVWSLTNAREIVGAWHYGGQIWIDIAQNICYRVISTDGNGSYYYGPWLKVNTITV